MCDDVTDVWWEGVPEVGEQSDLGFWAPWWSCVL